jgi:hypothetical protein
VEGTMEWEIEDEEGARRQIRDTTRRDRVKWKARWSMHQPASSD